MTPWLKTTEMIQSESKEIAELTEHLGIADSRNVRKIVDAAFSFAQDSLSSAKFSSRTDALLAVRTIETVVVSGTHATHATPAHAPVGALP